MDIKINVTAKEFRAMQAYAEFCHKWYGGVTPCNQCGKSLYGKRGDECYGCTRPEQYAEDKKKLYDKYGEELTTEFVENTYVRDYISASHKMAKLAEELDAVKDKYIEAGKAVEALAHRFTIVGKVTVTQKAPVIEPDYEPSVLADGSLNPDGEYGRMR